MVKKKKIFKVFPIISLWELITPGTWPVWGLRGLIGRINVGDHRTLLHTKYVSCEPDGFREDFLSFSHYKSMGANDHRGVTSLDPRGFIGKIYVGIIKHCYILNI